MSGPWEDYQDTPSAQADDGPWNDYAKEEEPPAEKDGAFVRGFKKANDKLAVSANLAIQDPAGAAQSIAAADTYAKNNQGMPEGAELMGAWDRGDGIGGGVGEVAGEIGADWSEARGLGDKFKSVGTNARAMGEGIAEQTGNMVAPMAGMIAGGVAGTKIGAPVGAAIGAPFAGVGAGPGAAVGGTVGGLLGAWGGASIGTAAIEGGGMAQQALMEAGIDPQDSEAVTAYLEQHGNSILKTAGVKGAIIGAVDTATMGLGGKLLNAPARAAADRAIAALGIDAADGAAVKLAKKSDAFKSLIANDAAYQASKTGAGNIARNTTVAAMEPAGEFAGEYLGEGVAKDNWDTKNAALEAFSSLGQSGAMYAGQKAYQAITKPLQSKIQPTPTPENPNPTPVDRPDPSNGPLSAAAFLLPAPSTDGTLYGNSTGDLSANRPAWVNPQNDPSQSSFGAGMDQQAGSKSSSDDYDYQNHDENTLEADIAAVREISQQQARDSDVIDGEFSDVTPGRNGTPIQALLSDGRPDAGFIETNAAGESRQAKTGNVPPKDYVPQGGHGMERQVLPGQKYSNPLQAKNAIQKAGAVTTHEAVQTGPKQFEVRPIAAPAEPVTRSGEPVTPSPVQPPTLPAATPVKPQGARKVVDRERDTVAHAVMRLGGISIDNRQDTTGEIKGNSGLPGIGYVWSKSGTGLDDMASKLNEQGFVPAGEMDNLGGVPWLQSVLSDHMAGRKEHFAPGSARQEAEWLKQEADRQEARTVQEEADGGFDSAETVTSDLLDDYDLLEIRAAAAAQHAAELDEIFGDSPNETVAGTQSTDRPAEETQRTETVGSGSAGAGQRPQGGQSDARAESPAEEAPSLELTQQTEVSAAADAAAQADRDKAEAAKQKKLDDAKKKADNLAAIKAANTKASETFELGQNADDNLSGQGGMFDSAPSLSELGGKPATDDKHKERAVAVELAIYSATNADPFRKDDAPLSDEDVRFILETLLDRARAGKLTTEQFAQSEIGERLDTGLMMALNEFIRQDPVAAIQAMLDRVDARKPASQIPVKDQAPVVEPVKAGGAEASQVKAAVGGGLANLREIVRQSNVSQKDAVATARAAITNPDRSEADRNELLKEIGSADAKSVEELNKALNKWWLRHSRERAEHKAEARRDIGNAELRRRETEVDKTLAMGKAASAEMDAASRPAKNTETGAFGPILREFRHDAGGAIAKLTELQDGEAVAALHHPEVGDIDLVWGSEGTGKSDGMGLAKLVKYHPEVITDLQGFIAELKKNDEKSGENRVRLESPTGFAAVRLDWDGKAKAWLMTAFEKKVATGTTTDTASSVDADDTARRNNDPVETIAQPEIGNSAADFPLDEATRSYDGISHRGRSNANGDRDEYERTISTAAEEAQPFAETAEQLAVLVAGEATLRADYIDEYSRLMRVRASTYSGHIAGGSKLNTKQVAARNSALDKAQARFSEWLGTQEGRLKSEVRNARTPDAKAKEAEEIQQAKNAKAEKKKADSIAFMTKLLSFRSGDDLRVGDSTVTKVNKSRDGYPTSLIFSFADGTKPFDDKIDLARVLYKGDKEALRADVDAAREAMGEPEAKAEKPAAQIKPAKEPSQAPLLDNHADQRGDKTSTAAFKKWFGDSKVVDAGGEPLVVYHGTTSDFSVFAAEAIGSNIALPVGAPQGFYFAKSREIAGRYALGDGANVMPVFVSLTNPAPSFEQFNADPSYDGFMNKSIVVARNPKQIKSAIGNNGDFDPDSPDIRYRLNSQPTKGIPLFSAKAIAKKLNDKLGISVKVAATEADLPAEIQDQIKRDGASGKVGGVFHNGQSYIIASNLSDAQHAVRLVLHEAIGHGGVQAVLGDKLGKVMAGIYRDMPAAIKRELEARYAGKLAGLSKAAREQEVAEEYVAHLAEHDPQNSVLERIVALIRKFIRDTFGEQAALKWSRNDIVQLLAEAKRAARNDGPRGGTAQMSGDADPAEALRIQQSVKGKSLLEVAGVMAQSKNPAVSNIAAKVQSTLGRLESEGVKLGFEVVHRGAPMPAEMANSRGFTDFEITRNGEKSIVVWINGADVTGYAGMEEEIILHELVHAATSAAFAYGRDNPNTFTGRTAQSLIAVSDAIAAHINQRFTDAESGKAELSDFEQSVRDGLNNAFATDDEVLAWALSSRDAQAYLEGIPYKGNTLWSRFVNAVRVALGMNAAQETALSEVLAVAEQLMSRDAANMAQYRAFGKQGRHVIQQASDSWASRSQQGGTRYRNAAEQGEAPALMEVSEADEAEFVASLKSPAAVTSIAGAMYKAKGTESPFFQRWFAKSKMVDRSGAPVAFVHRSFGDMSNFDDARLGSSTGTATAALGHFLARKDVGNVERYGPVADQFFIRMEKPKVITQEQFSAMGDWSVEQVKAYRAKAMQEGFDGMYVQGLAWPIVFEGKNIKGKRNTGTFDESANTRYSLNPTAEQRETLRKLGMLPKQADSLLRQIRDAGMDGFKAKMGEWGVRAREGLFDGLDGIKRAEEELGITDMNAMGYVSARLATGLADVMHGIMHYAAPEWRDGVIQARANTRGVLDVLSDLGSDLTPWLVWLGSKRAQILKAQGRENNMSDADIAEGLAMGAGKEAKFEQVYRDYAKINEAVLDLAEQGGLIDPAQRATWLTDYYVPFYRETEDSVFSGPRSSKGLSHQSAAIKALKGGTLPTNDLLENMLQGWTKRVDAAMKNKALMETVDNLKGSRFMTQEDLKWQRMVVPRAEVVKKIKGDRAYLEFWAEQLGMDETANHLQVAHELSKLDTKGYEELWGRVAPTDPDVIRVQRAGKNEYYRVHDEALLRSVKHMEGSQFNDPVTKLGRALKRVLTTGVTASPDFILRNFIRDAAHAWAINPDGFKFGIDSIKGLHAAFKQDQDYRDLMFAGASFQGGYVHATDPEASAQIIRRALEKKGMTRAQRNAYIGSLVTSPAAAKDMVMQGWQKYRELGDVVENSNRLSTYKAALASGKTKRQAAFEAKDVMDYSMRGNFAAAVWFTDMVPFLNARMQGLYKLGRATKTENGEWATEFAKKAGYIALFSLLLAAANDDDERYKELPDWDKDMNWHFWFSADQEQPFRIPKPFEIGLLAGTVPERMLHAALGSQDSTDLFRSVVHGVFETLAFNPVPQMVQPIREVQANRDFFRQSPIEDMSDEGKLPEARYDERTSAIGYGVGQVSGKLFGVSPKQVDHLVKGYTGTLGGYVLSLSNVVAEQFSDAERPAYTAADVPVLKVVYQGDTVRSTRYQGEFYDALNEVEQLHRTVKAYREDGQGDRAQSLSDANRDKLRHRHALGVARQQLGAIRKRMDAIYRDTGKGSEQKRKELDGLQHQANQVAERIAGRVKDDF